MGCYQTKIIGIDEKENKTYILSWKESIQIGCYKNNIPPELVSIILQYHYCLARNLMSIIILQKDITRPFNPNMLYININDESSDYFGSLGYSKLDYF
jgi:hypothetical protein